MYGPKFNFFDGLDSDNKQRYTTDAMLYSSMLYNIHVTSPLR